MTLVPSASGEPSEMCDSVTSSVDASLRTSVVASCRIMTSGAGVEHPARPSEIATTAKVVCLSMRGRTRDCWRWQSDISDGGSCAAYQPFRKTSRQKVFGLAYRAFRNFRFLYGKPTRRWIERPVLHQT